MTKEKGLSGSTLKIIAIIIMIIDHVGFGIWSRLPGMRYLVPHVMDWETWKLIYDIMRAVGRTAFPIICFLLVEGFFHTKSRPKYALRLFAFALISQLPFYYAFLDLTTRLNVFFSLFMGLMTIWGMDEIKKRWPKPAIHYSGWIIIVAVASGLAYWLHTDYDYKGILVIAALYIFRNNKQLAVIAGSVLLVILTNNFYYLLGFFLVWFYNGKRGLDIKFSFYMVYPVHLSLIYLFWRYLL
jgi:hypothetical protein